MMRDKIIARIDEILDPARSPWVSGGMKVLFAKPSKRKTVEQILAEGHYPVGFDFSTLSDDDLLVAFERIARRAYMQWA